ASPSRSTATSMPTRSGCAPATAATTARPDLPHPSPSRRRPSRLSKARSRTHTSSQRPRPGSPNSSRSCTRWIWTWPIRTPTPRAQTRSIWPASATRSPRSWPRRRWNCWRCTKPP
ncbi:MAG: Glutathione-regulated potassium-efflux system ATP-binding protein, partial [uncultured Lysobacter sp.]